VNPYEETYAEVQKKSQGTWICSSHR